MAQTRMRLWADLLVVLSLVQASSGRIPVFICSFDSDHECWKNSVIRGWTRKEDSNNNGYLVAALDEGQQGSTIATYRVTDNILSLLTNRGTIAFRYHFALEDEEEGNTTEQTEEQAGHAHGRRRREFGRGRRWGAGDIGEGEIIRPVSGGRGSGGRGQRDAEAGAGGLTLTACQDHLDPVFEVQHADCNFWCDVAVNYSCASADDVQIQFTATEGPGSTEIVIDELIITPTPDLDCEFSDDCRNRFINEPMTDSADWVRHRSGENAYLFAELNGRGSEQGDTAVVSLSGMSGGFRSPRGYMHIRYVVRSQASDGMLTVSFCTGDELQLSFPTENSDYIMTELAPYNCVNVHDVRIVFTAIRASQTSTIYLDRVRLYEGEPLKEGGDEPTTTVAVSGLPSSTGTTSTSPHLSASEISTTISTTKDDVTSVANLPSSESTTTGLGAQAGRERLVVPVLVSCLIAAVVIILVLVCVILYRRRKSQQPGGNTKLSTGLRSARNDYTNSAFLSSQTTVPTQPDILCGVSTALNGESPEAAVAAATTTIDGNSHSYYTIERIGVNPPVDDTDSIHNYYALNDQNDDVSVTYTRPIKHKERQQDLSDRDYALRENTVPDQAHAYTSLNLKKGDATTHDKDVTDGSAYDAASQLTRREDTSPDANGHTYYRLGSTTGDGERVPGDEAYGAIGAKVAELYDEEDYNLLAHKDHHGLAARNQKKGIQEGRLATGGDLFNDNVYNRFDVAETKVQSDGHQYLRKTPTRLYDQSRANENVGGAAGSDRRPPLDDDYQEPMQPGRDSPDDDYQEPIQPGPASGTGVYQSLKYLNEDGKDNRSIDAGPLRSGSDDYDDPMPMGTPRKAKQPEHQKMLEDIGKGSGYGTAWSSSNGTRSDYQSLKPVHGTVQGSGHGTAGSSSNGTRSDYQSLKPVHGPGKDDTHDYEQVTPFS